MIYFIQSGEYVKVGYTSNMKQRFSKYVTENPEAVKLLVTFKGGYDIEKKVHQQLKEYHHRGEWFHYNAEVRKRMLEIKKENRDNEEPQKNDVKKKNKAHIPVYNSLKRYCTASGMLDLQVYIRLEIASDLGLELPTVNKYINLCQKLKLLKKEGDLYYLT